MGNRLHVISHTHWDREWYMPLERHRLRLIALLDTLLDVFEADPSFKHFHMDGQMIPLDDYLAVRSERLPAIQRAARESKLSLGPWYVLQDEFLTSGEANVRNMLYGLKLARRYGEPLMVGYLPDSFGNISQMPQILRGFGIDNAVFGRGINRYDPEKAADPGAEPGEVGYKSELIWRGPDGSEVLGVFMANWYSNAMDIPSEPAEAAEFLAAARDNALRYATTGELLLMNGCDHTPTRSDVGRVLQAVAPLLDDEIVHSDMAGYIRALREAVGDDLQVAEGELRSEYTDGWGTLADTLSSRLYLKKANYRCQLLLERWVEPLTAVAWHLGRPHPTDQTWFAWATLMQNHPHDSICGCSCDEVHREMETRFASAETLADALRSDAAEAIGDKVDNSFTHEGAATVLVFNPLPGARSGIVEVEVQFPNTSDLSSVQVIDQAGRVLPVLGLTEYPGWAYKLPDDRFRTPYDCHRITCCVAVSDIPGMGYKTICVRPLQEPYGLRVDETPGVLENAFLHASIGSGGVLEVTDKLTGEQFGGLNTYDDSGDCGNEYIYRAPAQDRVITSAGAHDWRLSECGDSDLGAWAVVESDLMVPATSNAQVRSETTAPVRLRTHYFLGRDARHIEVSVEIDNEATDHRLRTLFPTDIVSDFCYADSQFDIVRRSITPWRGWSNPTNPQPQQAFVDISDGRRGLCIANRGLPAYEVLRSGRNTIALTLLRSVGELGDWGKFPTPEAQGLGVHLAEYAIIPHTGNISDPEGCDAARIAYEYCTPLWGIQAKHFMHPHKERWSNDLPAEAELVSVSPTYLVLSAVKKTEDRDGLVVRVYNPFEIDSRAQIGCLWPPKAAYLLNLAEERQSELELSAHNVTVPVPSRKIVTVELVI